MNIVLIGFMGSGKTKVGRLIAEKLGWKFFDSDAVIESESKMTVREIFAGHGESHFRKLESKAISKLSRMDECVISTGGGVPLNPENMKRLKKNGVIIWLNAGPQLILSRLKREQGGITARPLLSHDKPLISIKRILAQRCPHYRKAQIKIDTSKSKPATIANKIIREINNPK